MLCENNGCFSEGCKTYFHTLKRHEKKLKSENLEKAQKAQRKRQRLINVSELKYKGTYVTPTKRSDAIYTINVGIRKRLHDIPRFLILFLGQEISIIINRTCSICLPF